MSRIRAIVVDDEISNRTLIARLISESNPDFDILGQADSVKTAYDLIQKTKPQVVFLDIKMPDGNGFSLLNMFDPITFDVVFISGFDSYALQAFEFNALDYILKPIDPEKFAKNLNRVQARIEKQGVQPEFLKAIARSYDPNKLIISKIPIHSGNQVFLLSLEDILYIKSENGYTAFKASSGETHLSSKQLSDFEFIVETHPFMVRVNKGTYINLNYITSYSKGVSCFLTMKDATLIEISRRKKGEILELLTGKKEQM